MKQNKQCSGKIPERYVVHIAGSVTQFNSDLVTVEAFKYSKHIVVFKKSMFKNKRLDHL